MPLLCAHGFPTRSGGTPPDLRSAPPPSAPRSVQRGQKEGPRPIPFVRAQTVFRDPSFRAPPRGEWEQQKGGAVKQGAVSGVPTGRGRDNACRGVGANAACTPPHFAAPVGMPCLRTKRYANGACQLGRGGRQAGWLAGRGKRRGACADRSVHVGWEGDATPERGAGGERRGAVPRELAFVSCLRMMNEGAGGRGEAHLSRAPFARKWAQGAHTKGGGESWWRAGKGGVERAGAGSDMC
ncbi:hypothetical protein EDB86DRAFT_3247653 [Lactarius hatsudake]|nr:hypothetical protein EDB86DRAFT_3247653 [Lactarius hatsudake]